jgi:hypothetical protein
MTTQWYYVKSSRQKPISSEQHKRFIETARELGCDEDEAAFDEKLRRIASVKPKPKRSRSKKASDDKPS